MAPLQTMKMAFDDIQEWIQVPNPMIQNVFLTDDIDHNYDVVLTHITYHKEQ